MAAPLPWPTFVPTPIHASIAPLDQVVGEENPYTGAREVMLRWSKWRAKLDWNAMPYKDALAVVGHFSRGRGGKNTFQVRVAFYRVSRGNKAGSVTLSGAHAAGLETATLSGGTGLFATGDWFHLTASSVPRAHVCVAAESGGSVSIYPALRQAYSSGTAINLVSSGFILDTMELPTEFDLPTFDVGPNPKYAMPFSIELISAFRRTF